MPAAFANRAASRPSTERSTLSGELCTWMSMAPARSSAPAAGCVVGRAARTSAIDAAMMQLRMAVWLRKRLVSRRTIQAELLELLRGVELPPEIEGHPRRWRSQTCQDAVHETEQRAGEILRAQPAHRGELAVDDAILERSVGDHRIDHPRHVHRLAILDQHAGAVHRRRHRRRSV